MRQPKPLPALLALAATVILLVVAMTMMARHHNKGAGLRAEGLVRSRLSTLGMSLNRGLAARAKNGAA